MSGHESDGSAVGLSVPVIVAIVLGSLAGLVTIIGIIVCLVRQANKRSKPDNVEVMPSAWPQGQKLSRLEVSDTGQMNRGTLVPVIEQVEPMTVMQTVPVVDRAPPMMQTTRVVETVPVVQATRVMEAAPVVQTIAPVHHDSSRDLLIGNNGMISTISTNNANRMQLLGSETYSMGQDVGPTYSLVPRSEVTASLSNGGATASSINQGLSDQGFTLYRTNDQPSRPQIVPPIPAPTSIYPTLPASSTGNIYPNLPTTNEMSYPVRGYAGNGTTMGTQGFTTYHGQGRY